MGQKLIVNRQKRNIFTVNRQMSEPKLAVKFLRYPYCDENHIFPIEPILKHKQVACVTGKMLFTIFKYLFSFQRYLSF